MAKRTFIDGIFNYCDRWCERCRYTHSCRTWHEGEKSRRRSLRQGKDPADPSVLAEDLARSLKKATRLLQRLARQNNIDLDELARQVDPAALKSQHDRVNRHPLAREAMHYFDSCTRMLEPLRDSFKASVEDMQSRSDYMDVEHEVPVLHRVHEAVAVLSWDCSLVAAKASRVVFGQTPLDEREGAQNDRHDVVHTAGLVRRLLARDQQALLALYEWDESLRDPALTLLAQTEKMLRAIDKLVPDSRNIPWPPVE